jgi:hypothetical protein
VRRCNATWLVLGLILSVGCEGMPLFNENRQNFPPWEKLPEGGGITYVEKFTHDPGLDPIYLALIKYEDDAALAKAIDTFGLIQHSTLDAPTTFAEVLDNKPSWFPLKKVTHLYVFPEGTHEYVANLWVNADEKTMIIERSWW